MIHLFTDGSARGNPGPGGYGAILRYGPHEKELTQGFRHTTNNRMELLAVIVGLEAVTRPDLPIRVVSDSKYVVDAVEKEMGFRLGRKNLTSAKRPMRTCGGASCASISSAKSPSTG